MARPPACLPAPCSTACRVLHTLHTLKDLLPDTHIVLLGVLPRGNGGMVARYAWPSAYTQAIHMINSHFRCGSLCIGRA